jgi:hypothetical protein
MFHSGDDMKNSSLLAIALWGQSMKARAHTVMPYHDPIDVDAVERLHHVGAAVLPLALALAIPTPRIALEIFEMHARSAADDGSLEPARTAHVVRESRASSPQRRTMDCGRI